MKIASEELINDLIGRTYEVLKQGQDYLLLDEKQLNHKSSPESWSVLECLEHLNLYGRFYLQEIQKRMSDSNSPSRPFFKSGMLGNYFAKSMLPASTGKIKKMKTFSNMNPVNSKPDKNVIGEFIDQQKEMVRLLEAARKKDLNKIKCGITITKLIKLKLGDTFRFVIYHNQRHILQANKVLKSIA